MVLTFDGDPMASLYRVTLFNTIGRFGGAVPRAVAELTSTQPRFTIPIEVLLPAGQPWWYFARITTIRGGYTGATSGDLQTFTLPTTESYVDSPVFVSRPL